jgi:hypothetical protein
MTRYACSAYTAGSITSAANSKRVPSPHSHAAQPGLTPSMVVRDDELRIRHQGVTRST